MSYIGNEPIVSATRTVTEVSATVGQTVFTANGGYTVGFIDVFVNGSKLTNSDFTATNGTTITLNEAAQASDIVRLEALGTFLTSSGLTANNPEYTGTLTGGTGVINIGSGQLYKDGSGNVGIGTSSPNEAITIQRGSGQNAAITLRANGNASSAESFIGQGTDNALYLYNRANGNIIFGANNIGHMNLLPNGNLQFNSGYGSVATAYGCRAWVNFNGTGTVAIRASGNVSSITDNGTGDYTVNFTTAMPDANYSAVGMSMRTSNNSSNLSINGDATYSNGFTTASVRVQNREDTNALVDPLAASVSIFR